MTGLTGRRNGRKKEGLLSALFGGGREEERRVPRETPRSPSAERRRALTQPAPVQETRRRPVNIDIDLDERAEKPRQTPQPARPAARTPSAARPAPQQRPQTPARAPAKRASHEVLPEPYRSYYASLPKKPYYPVAVPLHREEETRVRSFDVSAVYGSAAAGGRALVTDRAVLVPAAKAAPDAPPRKDVPAAPPEAAPRPASPARKEEPVLSAGVRETIALQAVAAPYRPKQWQCAAPQPAAVQQPEAAQGPEPAQPAVPVTEPEPVPVPAAKEPPAPEQEPPAPMPEPEQPAPEETIWDKLRRAVPAPSGRPAPLVRFAGEREPVSPVPAQPPAQEPAAPDAADEGERAQAEALAALLSQAEAARAGEPDPSEPEPSAAEQPEPEQRPESPEQPPLLPPSGPGRYVYVDSSEDWDDDPFFTNWDVEHFEPEEPDEPEEPEEPQDEPAPLPASEPDEEDDEEDSGAEEEAQDRPPWEETEPAPEETAAQAGRPAPKAASAVLPALPSSLLEYSPEPDTESVEEELNANGEKLIETLQSFGVRATMLEACRGPAVTRYELQPAAGVKISKITNLADDVAMNLAATGVRIEAPIPGKAAVGIEVPNRKVSTVRMRELIESAAFRRAESPLTTVLGRDIAGELVLADLAKMPHLLIAGSTGSGKSVCINSLLVSLLYKSTPQEVRFLMIDPKVVELGIYNGIPHLIVPVVTDPRKAAGALGWAVTEMLRRYQQFAANNVRDLTSYNRLAEERGYIDEQGMRMEHMPRIVIVIDELADLMMAAPNEVEDSICRLAQMARAAGMHLVIATQRPSVDVITGIIKANIPSRIAFAVSSQVDSRTILDMGGAEKLLGRGDMLFSPVGMRKPMRVQGCFIDDREIEAVVEFIRRAASAEYDESVMEEIERGGAQEQAEASAEPETDPMIPEAVRCVVEAGQASTSLLQRRLRLGYARAGRLVDEMEQMGVVGPHEGSKPRQVLLSWQQYLEMAQNRGWEN